MLFPTWYMVTVAVFLVTLAGFIAIANLIPQDTPEPPETFGELEAEWVFGDLEEI
jgi:hypothetical protein